MAIPTSRTKEKAKINLHQDLCNGCGLCIHVCKDFSLELKNKKVTLSNEALFECFGCGQCMAVCPNGAIEIFGRNITPGNLFDLPPKQKSASYHQFVSTLQRRRSIRDFKKKAIRPEIIKKILDASKTAPMGLPPSDVHVLVLDSAQKTRAFAEDYSAYLRGLRYMTSNTFLWLMQPFLKKATVELFSSFLKPLFKAYVNKMKEGKNFITYDAPLAMYFYGTSYSDPADPIVAATFAMLAAESLGLGTCMLGAIHPFIQSGARARKFREEHHIKHKSKEGLFVIFGYPKFKYQKGIKRTFANVNYL